MKKRSTTLRGTSSKATKAKPEETSSEEQTPSALCREELAKTLFSLKLMDSLPELQQMFNVAKIFLETFESEVLSGPSEDILLIDFDETILNRQKRCEHALKEIDLTLCAMLIQARADASKDSRVNVHSLDSWLDPNFPSETH